MPRYFQSHVTGRQLVVGDRSFIFEPVEPMGGSWLGVLAVDDESAASILASSDAAWEIDLEKFETLKKKRAGAATAQGFVPSQTPRLPPQPLVQGVAPAARPTGSHSDEPVVGAGKAILSVTLLVTDKKPPVEPLLEVGAAPKRRKAA